MATRFNCVVKMQLLYFFKKWVLFIQCLNREVIHLLQLQPMDAKK